METQIRNNINQLLDTLPEEEMYNVYWALVSIQKNYLNNWNLFGKGVKVYHLFKESPQLIGLWDAAFARNISEETKHDVYYNQFKWHIFSYEKQDCLKGDAAKAAFDSTVKDEVYVMYQSSPYIMLYSNANELLAADFDNEQDIYLFDKGFTWTYVNTHESMCGPYFATSE